MKTKSNPFLFLFAAALLTQSASAATWQWDGSAGTGNWKTDANWNPDTGNPNVGTLSGPAATYPDRLQVNGAQALIYTANEGTTNYGGAGIRGLVIGSGANGSGTMTITGGTFSGLASTTGDAIGNGDNNTGILNISGTGTYIGSGLYTRLGLGGGAGRVSTLNVLAGGTARITQLEMFSDNATLNLDGGVLEVNSISQLALQGVNSTSTVNFNGGTLMARQNNATFISGIGTLTVDNGLTSQRVFVKNGGAKVDTNNFNVTITSPLLADTVSTGGGLTKQGIGLLTLGAPSTITGAVTVEAGGLGVKSGSVSWAPSSFTHSGSTLNFDLGGILITSPPVINVVGNLTLNTTDIDVNISGAGIPFASEIIILDYGTKSGTGSLKLNTATLPLGITAQLLENTVDGYYYLTTTSTALVWSGDSNPDGTGNWDTTSLNWDNNTAAFTGTTPVLFPDISGGGTVTLTTNVAPTSFTISNALGNPYTFAGTGIISGATGILKEGTGIATFDGAAHTFSGATTISAGTLSFAGSGNQTLSGAINNSGTLSLAGSGNHTVSGAISGTGPLTKADSGTLTLTAVNSYTGNTTVSDAGVLEIGATGKLYNGGHTNARTVTVGSGSTLRVNSWNYDGIGSIGPVQFDRGRLVVNGGTIEYVGGTNTTDNGTSGRNFTVGTGGATLKASNTGLWTIALHNPNDVESATIQNNTGLTLGGTGDAVILKFINGVGALTKTDSGTWTLSGTNTYTGDTTVNGGTLTLSAGGSQLFNIGSVGVNNKITGTTSGIVNLNGNLLLDLSGAGTTTGNSWNVVDVANLSGTSSYGGTFTVASTLGAFAPSGSNWTISENGVTYQFSQTTGVLSVVIPGGYNSWAAQITNGLNLRTDDADGDGFNNLREFLFGTSPIASNGALVTTTRSGANLVLRWLQRETGATYTLEQSTTLNTGSWSDVVSPLPALDGNQAGTPTDYDYFTVSIPLGSGKAFFRIEGIEN